MKSKNRALAFEHQVLRTLKSLKITNEKILVAVSGGVDSMVLLELLRLWQPYFHYEIAVAHVHHGRAKSRQLAFRRKAKKTVAEFCQLHKLQFFTNEKSPVKILKSESELRDFRWSQLRLWQKQWGANYIAVAHHQNDLLETQLLRLIRGTSHRGLRAMTHRDGEKIRPLLSLTREQISAYAKGRIAWCEDPSNQESDSMRNWLRHDWLPQLEERTMGSLKSLARSIELIASESEIQPSEQWLNGGVRRKSLSTLTKKQQSAVMVEYLNRLGIKQYQQSHVNEILRRLDTRRKSTKFLMLGLSWTIHPDLILASRV